MKAGVAFLKFLMSQKTGAAELCKYDATTLKVATFCAEPCAPTV